MFCCKYVRMMKACDIVVVVIKDFCPIHFLPFLRIFTVTDFFTNLIKISVESNTRLFAVFFFRKKPFAFFPKKANFKM